MHGKKMKIGTEVGLLSNLKPFVVWKKSSLRPKMQQKNQACVIITRLRITTKMPLLQDKPLSRINWCVDGIICFEEFFSGLEE